MTVEMVLLAPVLVLFVTFVVAAGRFNQAGTTVREAQLTPQPGRLRWFPWGESSPLGSVARGLSCSGGRDGVLKVLLMPPSVRGTAPESSRSGFLAP
ncbi:MAG: hypothetical protein RJA51_1735 [Actinomycetota bacterium]